MNADTLRGAVTRVKASVVAGRQKLESRRDEAIIGTTFDVVERDGAIAGGILAGALAYRLFLFLLPLMLVAVGTIGALASATGHSPDSIVSQTGLVGLVSTSVSSAAAEKALWYAIIIGVPALVLVSSGLLRVVAGIHRLAWGMPVRGARPSLRVTITFVGAMLAILAITAVSAAVRHHSGVDGLVTTLLAGVVYGAAWFGFSAVLPHGEAPWRALLPGAVMFGAGAQALHLFSVYVVTGLATNRQDTYGALGLAAAVLFTLYLIGRLIVLTAVLSATLWHGGQTPQPS
ncbi:MAG TPA: hypothetical protein VI316_00995 [Candidatus Dormibacteraeota bacterium]